MEGGMGALEDGEKGSRDLFHHIVNLFLFLNPIYRMFTVNMPLSYQRLSYQCQSLSWINSSHDEFVKFK